MNYCQLRHCDIANGDGVRVVLFVAGCQHHCKGCHNPGTWDTNAGKPFTEETMVEIIEHLKPDWVKGLTITGGDPFLPANQNTVWKIMEKVRSTYPNKDIWVYTGYKYEQLQDSTLLNWIDVLVDGEFVADLKDIRLKFRGSSNQRLIDVPATMKNGVIVNWEGWKV